MSTVIIIQPGPKKPPEFAASGNEVVDQDGVVVATFQNADQAIAYLKSIKKLEGLAE